MHHSQEAASADCSAKKSKKAVLRLHIGVAMQPAFDLCNCFVAGNCFALVHSLGISLLGAILPNESNSQGLQKSEMLFKFATHNH